MQFSKKNGSKFFSCNKDKIRGGSEGDLAKDQAFSGFSPLPLTNDIDGVDVVDIIDIIDVVDVVDEACEII